MAVGGDRLSVGASVIGGNGSRWTGGGVCVFVKEQMFYQYSVARVRGVVKPFYLKFSGAGPYVRPRPRSRGLRSKLPLSSRMRLLRWKLVTGSIPFSNSLRPVREAA